VDSNSTRWWWTPARRGLCRRCGLDVAGQMIAYEFEGRTVYCGRCAEQLGIADLCRESRRARLARQLRLIEEVEQVVTLAGTAA
jgi:hypothetical protein